MRDARVYLLAAYLEDLLRRGDKDPGRHVADASRYLRFLLREAGEDGITAFVARSTNDAEYGRRLRRRVARFADFVRALEASDRRSERAPP
ncbi:MAG TPA: hypothetical protein VF234_10720 [Limnochordia bacterium]